MKPIPDFVIYLAGLGSTVFFVFCGIYFVSNRAWGIWNLYGGIVLGLLAVFLYWQNDISKAQASKAANKQVQQAESKNAPTSASPPTDPRKTTSKLEKSQKKQPIALAKDTETTLPFSPQTPYSQLTNDQLRKDAIILVDKMRGYLERRNLQEMSRLVYYQQQMRQAKTDGEKQIVWDAQTHDLLTAPNLNYEYSEKFKADAILLRDEIVSRLPKDFKSDDKDRADYDHPTNPIGLNMVIDNLEKLAKILPK